MTRAARACLRPWAGTVAPSPAGRSVRCPGRRVAPQAPGRSAGRSVRIAGTVFAFAVAASIPALPAAAAAPTRQEPPVAVANLPITVSFFDAPIREVLFAFADFSGRSIVAGAEVAGSVSAEIRDQPWDVALDAILEAHGLVAQEGESGIIRVASAPALHAREAVVPLETAPFRIKYAQADEVLDPVAALLSERGRVSAGQGANTVVVTDVPRVVRSVERLVAALDVRVRQIDIAAKIVFVNRTEMEALGITYDLTDRGGNQLNLLKPGVRTGADAGDGQEQVPRGADVIHLAGNSVAALGNATQRIASPTLSVLTSLVLGRHTLVGFVDALESVQLTDVEAQPSVRVMDNRTAKIVVGEETPVRVIDAGAQLGVAGGGAQGSAVPLATVDYKETGVILEVTPRVASDDEILLELVAERSSADLAPSDVGVVFRRQKAESHVLVRNGEVVVIGGLTVTERGEVRSGIPLLMHLPLIGRLFSSRSESSTERDLLILVRPTLVPPAADSG